MNTVIDPELDLVVSRIIRAPREAVWSAWTDPVKFEQWRVPAPATCKVAEMELRPGGAFTTEISEDGGDFHPDGTEYTATAVHKDTADRNMHDERVFQDGWGTVTRQLAELAER